MIGESSRKKEMSDTILSKTLKEVERLKKELKRFEETESTKEVAKKLAKYTTDVRDPLLPGFDKSNSRWKEKATGGGCCSMF